MNFPGPAGPSRAALFAGGEVRFHLQGLWRCLWTAPCSLFQSELIRQAAQALFLFINANELMIQICGARRQKIENHPVRALPTGPTATKIRPGWMRRSADGSCKIPATVGATVTVSFSRVLCLHLC